MRLVQREVHREHIIYYSKEMQEKKNFHKNKDKEIRRWEIRRLGDKHSQASQATGGRERITQRPERKRMMR